MRLPSRVALLLSLVFLGCPPPQQQVPIVMTASPASVELSQGETVSLTVSIKKGSETLSSSGTSWTSSATSVASVAGNADGSATVTGVSPGTATLTARNGSSSATVQVVVQAPIVTRLELTPAGASLAKGTTLKLTATAVFTNNATLDFSSDVEWSSSDEAVLTVGATGLVSGVAEGTATVTANLQGLSATLLVTVTAAELARIELTPAAPVLAAGTSVQLTATGVFSDGSTQDLTSQVTWVAPGSSVLTLSTSGLVTGVVPGSASVSASMGGVSGSLTITVTAATLSSITVSPATPSVARGTAVQLTATGHFTNATSQDLTGQVTWASGGAQVSVSTAGLAKGEAVGSAVVTATLNGLSGSATVTVTDAELVSIGITGFTGAAQLPAGRTQQLTATGVFTDGSTQPLTTQVVWSSSATNVSVSNATGSHGLLTAGAPGTATVSAEFDGVTGTLSVEVTAAVLDAIEVTAPNASLPLGVTQQYAATGVYSFGPTQDLTGQATWSADAGVATISNAAGSKGLLTPVAVGSTQVSATFDGVTGSTGLSVTAAQLVRVDVTGSPLSLAKGRTTQLSASAVYTAGAPVDVTTQASWSSADGGVAAVNATGLVTAVEEGSTTISATFGAQTGAVAVSVTAKELVTLTVSPSTNVSVPVGLTQSFTVEGEYTDGSHEDLTTQVTWSTGAAATASISNAPGSRGRLTAHALGSTTVQATLGGVTSAAVTVTVSDPVLISIALTPASASVAKGRTQQFTATGTYSDGSTPNLTGLVTWASDGPAVGVSNAVGSQGLATALAVGSANVTAVLSNFPTVTGTAVMTVTDPEILSITVSPSPISVTRGATQQLTATAVLTDATLPDITSAATWAVTDPAIASVDASGVLHGLTEGTTTVRASKDGVNSALVTVTVTLALEEVLVTSVDGGALTMPKGRSLELKATARYSDSSLVEVTAAWASDDAGVATVTDGTVFGAGVGTANISATFDGVTGAVEVTVTPAVVETLSLGDLAVPRGATRTLALTGALSDGTPIDPATVTWGSDDQTQVTVDTVGNAHVLNTATLGATVQVTATRDGVTATATVTVAPAALTALSIDNAPSASLPHGRSWPLTASGAFSDGTSGLVTTGLVWNTSASAVISVTSTSSGADVRAETNAGSADITVGSLTDGAVVSAPVTVTAGAAVVDVVAVNAVTIPRGRTEQLVANVTWSDGAQSTVGAGASWSSADPAVVDVTSGGSALAQGAAGSSASVTATFDGVSGSGLVTVGAPELVSLTVSPATVNLAKGLTQPLSVAAVYGDGSTTPLPSLTWLSSAPLVVSVDASGVVKAEAASGAASITASSGSVTSNAVTVTAEPAVMTSLTATAPSPLKQNVVARATATANYSDGTTADVTSLVTWASAGAASVSNVIGASGTIIPSATGTALISATSGSFSADAGQVAVTQVASVPDAGAPGHIVISQVYVSGGSVGSTWNNDFIELHNPSDSAITLSNHSVQYASGTNTGTWSQVVSLPTLVIPAGGFYLVQLGRDNNATTPALPSPDFNGGATINAGGNGKIALVASTTPLSGTCPAAVDLIGFGSANCREGAATVAGLNATTGAFRGLSGCVDRNQNGLDFVTGTPSPRNGQTSRVMCEYSASETDSAEEADYCNVQFPTAMTFAAGSLTDTVYGRLFEAGSTEAAGAPAGVTMQFGYGPSVSNPAAGGWLWWPGSFNVQVGNDDEFQAAFVAPATGTYSYAARVSLDGGAWTYCDLNGAGSNSGLSFETTQLGTLTVP